MSKTPDTFIQETVVKAGAIALSYFGKIGAYKYKSDSPSDALTKADLLSDAFITKEIKKHFPSHGIMSEESGTYQDDAEYIWHVDPIDGTLNFATGVPMWGVMMALSRRGEVILNAVYMPVTKELFFAKKGKGAYRNGKRIHCSKNKKWLQSVGSGTAHMRPRTAKFWERVLQVKNSEHFIVNCFGCMALAGTSVASGRRDWLISITGALHDFAPVYLLLKEGGCTVTNTHGEPWTMKDRGMIAANSTLHKELLKLTQGI